MCPVFKGQDEAEACNELTTKAVTQQRSTFVMRRGAATPGAPSIKAFMGAVTECMRW